MLGPSTIRILDELQHKLWSEILTFIGQHVEEIAGDRQKLQPSNAHQAPDFPFVDPWLNFLPQAHEKGIMISDLPISLQKMEVLGAALAAHSLGTPVSKKRSLNIHLYINPH
jgi:hypothetical protein